MKVKITSILVILIILLNSTIIFADLEDTEENVNINTIKQEVIQTTSSITDSPKINSRIALVYDRASGRILFDKNGNKITPMASTTKIMTAIVVVENSNLSDIVTIDSKSAGTGGSRLGLKKNDKITVNDLLYGLMLRSGNDAAVALAVHVGGSVNGFAELMNKKARELGLTSTHFVVPHGLDMDGHYTTAYELAKIADYALKNEKIREIVSTKTCTININNNSKTISNTNELLGSVSGVYGVKTGFTNGAGRCLVTSCTRGENQIITVVLGCDTKRQRTLDSAKLIEYAFNNYTRVNVENLVKKEFEKWKQINLKRIYINKAKTNDMEVELANIEKKQIPIKKGEEKDITIEINAIYEYEAPLLKNSKIGNIIVKKKGEMLETIDIILENKVDKKSVIDYFIELIGLIANYRIIK